MNLEKTLEEIETSGKIISDTKIEQIPIYGTDVSGYGSRYWLIEVIAGYEEKEVPKNSLKERKKARKELKCENLLVITWDYERQENFYKKNIKFMPLWKWLLLE